MTFSQSDYHQDSSITIKCDDCNWTHEGFYPEDADHFPGAITDFRDWLEDRARDAHNQGACRRRIRLNAI